MKLIILLLLSLLITGFRGQGRRDCNNARTCNQTITKETEQ